MLKTREKILYKPEKFLSKMKVLLLENVQYCPMKGQNVQRCPMKFRGFLEMSGEETLQLFFSFLPVGICEMCVDLPHDVDVAPTTELHALHFRNAKMITKRCKAMAKTVKSNFRQTILPAYNIKRMCERGRTASAEIFALALFCQFC